VLGLGFTLRRQEEIGFGRNLSEAWEHFSCGSCERRRLGVVALETLGLLGVLDVEKIVEYFLYTCVMQV